MLSGMKEFFKKFNLHHQCTLEMTILITDSLKNFIKTFVKGKILLDVIAQIFERKTSCYF